MGKFGTIWLLICSCAIVSFSAQEALAKFTTIYAFQGGSDGQSPYAQLLRDKSGNLYGTTAYGGGDGCGGSGCGTVFKIASDGTETTLHAFNGSDGAQPTYTPLIEDKSGNLYGTTLGGGAGGDGAVFRIAPNGTETTLYSFTGGSDGVEPAGPIVRDGKGNIYGTTAHGGGANNDGIVYKLKPDGTETVLYSFTGGTDGKLPNGLIAGPSGNFYGTVEKGGAGGLGAIFEVSPKGIETVLYSFGAPGVPVTVPVADLSGNLYVPLQLGDNGWGAIFELSTDGTGTTLYSFTGGSDGGDTYAPLVLDASGNIYGVTFDGGSSGCGGWGCGTVFKLGTDETLTVLHTFKGNSDGGTPGSGLIADKRGHLYGTTSVGGGSAKAGTVFTLKE